MGLVTAAPFDPASTDTVRPQTIRQPILLLLVGAAWWLVYSRLAAAAFWLTSAGVGLSPQDRLGSAVEFFLNEAPERTRRVLAALGTVLAPS